ncbi:MAG TPA: hypothetical protein VGH11_06685 [Jatrophihabitans sp.]
MSVAPRTAVDHLNDWHGGEWFWHVAAFFVGCLILAAIWDVFRRLEGSLPMPIRVVVLGLGEAAALLFILIAGSQVYRHLPNLELVVGWTLVALIAIALSLLYAVVYAKNHLDRWELLLHQVVTAVAAALVLSTLVREVITREAASVPTTAGNLMRTVVIVAVVGLVLLAGVRRRR